MGDGGEGGMFRGETGDIMTTGGWRLDCCKCGAITFDVMLCCCHVYSRAVGVRLLGPAAKTYTRSR